MTKNGSREQYSITKKIDQTVGPTKLNEKLNLVKLSSTDNQV